MAMPCFSALAKKANAQPTKTTIIGAIADTQNSLGLFCLCQKPVNKNLKFPELHQK